MAAPARLPWFRPCTQDEWRDDFFFLLQYIVKYLVVLSKARVRGTTPTPAAAGPHPGAILPHPNHAPPPRRPPRGRPPLRSPPFRQEPQRLWQVAVHFISESLTHCPAPSVGAPSNRSWPGVCASSRAVNFDDPTLWETGMPHDSAPRLCFSLSARPCNS